MLSIGMRVRRKTVDYIAIKMCVVFRLPNDLLDRNKCVRAYVSCRRLKRPVSGLWIGLTIITISTQPYGRKYSGGLIGTAIVPRTSVLENLLNTLFFFKKIYTCMLKTRETCFNNPHAIHRLAHERKFFMQKTTSGKVYGSKRKFRLENVVCV